MDDVELAGSSHHGGICARNSLDRRSGRGSEYYRSRVETGKIVAFSTLEAENGREPSCKEDV
jgi:hypothetical protein